MCVQRQTVQYNFLTHLRDDRSVPDGHTDRQTLTVGCFSPSVRNRRHFCLGFCNRMNLKPINRLFPPPNLSRFYKKKARWGLELEISSWLNGVTREYVKIRKDVGPDCSSIEQATFDTRNNRRSRRRADRYSSDSPFVRFPI